MNTEIKTKVNPKDDKIVYNQNLPLPIHLKEDLIVELALMHKFGFITTILFSKYASPIFAQKKPNGKLPLPVDLRKVNSLIVDDYTNNNHPVSTLSDAAPNLAGKSLFYKLDCSQAYHCLQMADHCLHLILLAESLPTEDLHNVSADLCLFFQVSCVCIWTQSLKLTSVLNTWMTLERSQ